MGKITDEELKQVSDLKGETSQLIYSLGEIQYQKVSLDLLEDQVREQIKDFKAKELQFLNELKQKYGNVSINIETGEF
jgi:hypothetical protein